MKVLVLGASGMLGHTVLRFFARSDGYKVAGTMRSASALGLLPIDLRDLVISGIDVENPDNLLSLFARVNPDLVINCIGLVKQLAAVDDPLLALPINAMLPHRLARLCRVSGARLVHISTDCVFSGKKGAYTESDLPDAEDLYGRSKYLGEVNYPNAITLRTSIIGHELSGAQSLLDWFLAQKGRVRGYRRAVFSGVPTVELARIIRDFVVPHADLHGVFHVSAEAINKFELLKLIAQVYKKQVSIEPDDKLVIDRSLNSFQFKHVTGYAPPDWAALVQEMYSFQ